MPNLLLSATIKPTFPKKRKVLHGVAAAGPSDRAIAIEPKLNTSAFCSLNLKKFCYLQLLNQVPSLTSSAKMQNPQIYCRKIG
jgi:hypothetical protein